MSGPKVVRVISLEEKQQTVKKHQANMLFALNKLRSFAGEHQLLTSSLKEMLEQRQAQFDALNETDFANIESTASDHISYLAALHQEVENDLVEQKQQHKRRIRQIKMASQGLQQAFQQRQQQVPAALAQLTMLPLDTRAESLQQYEKTLQTALASLTQQSLLDKNTLSDELLALQSRLKTEESVQPLESWISAQKPIINKQQQRLDRLLSRLELMNAPAKQATLQSFIDRAEALEQADTQKSLYTLQLDSLLLDVSQFAQTQQTTQSLKDELQQALETIQDVVVTANTEQTAAMISGIQATISAPNISQDALENKLEEAQAFILIQETAFAAQSRRQAVLQGLSNLGYQVSENMSTAWVENGRLVVRKASAADYGIELTTNPEMQRLQARVVVNSDASQRSADLDTEAEEVWCGDFSSLRDIIQAQNGELIVDKALPIGSQKLKELSFQNKADEERKRQYRQQQSNHKRQTKQ